MKVALMLVGRKSIGFWLSVLLLSGCDRASTARTAKFEDGNGWLISKLADEPYEVRAVGDRKHAWLWSEGKPGVRAFDPAQTGLETLLPDVPIKDVVSLGDGRNGVAVPTGKPGLFLIGLATAANPRNVLPDGITVDWVLESDEGVWIATEQLNSTVTSSLFFLEKGSLRLQGPWQTLGTFDMEATSRHLISTSERARRQNEDGTFERVSGPVIDGALEVEIVDRRTGMRSWAVTVLFMPA